MQTTSVGALALPDRGTARAIESQWLITIPSTRTLGLRRGNHAGRTGSRWQTLSILGTLTDRCLSLGEEGGGRHARVVGVIAALRHAEERCFPICTSQVHLNLPPSYRLLVVCCVRVAA